jgi:15-cis-phytoene synthase
MQDNFAYCEQLVREGDKDRYLATLFAPAAKRGALFALYAFNHEIARVRESVREPLAGEVRLQWWRDVITSKTAEARAHPVAAALIDTIAHFRIPVEPLVDLIEARSFDLYDDPMPSMAALEGYATKTSTALIELASVILDHSNRPISDALRAAGVAYAFAGLLRAFPIHAARGQLYVPLDVLQRTGAKPEDVLAGRNTRELRAALAGLRQRARSHFDAFAKGERAVSPAQKPALLPAGLVPLYLDRLERSATEPFQLVQVPQWRRQWALWWVAGRL